MPEVRRGRRGRGTPSVLVQGGGETEKDTGGGRGRERVDLMERGRVVGQERSGQEGRREVLRKGWGVRTQLSGPRGRGYKERERGRRIGVSNEVRQTLSLNSHVFP